MLNPGEDNNWGRTGEALGAGAKIYGYRVDNVHMETYKILGGLHRHGLGDHEIEVVMGEDKADEDRPEGGDGEDTKELENSGNKRKKRVLKFTDA